MKLFDKKKRNLLGRIYSYEVPSILIWLALIFLSFKAYSGFLGKGDFSPVITLYFAMVALVIALASVTFAYSKTKDNDDKKFLTSAGELFLYATLALISSFLISWLSFEAKDFLKEYLYYKYYSYFLILIFSWGQSFLFFAANSFHKALVDLERYLWFKVREKIK